MKRDFSVFLSKGFLAALLLLLLNDLYLKNVFHNWITGKLSDFAGLFVFSLFWIALFPKRIVLILILVIIFFTFWKSPASQPFIDFLNYNFCIIERTIDYSDCIALIVLPFAAFYFKKCKPALENKYILLFVMIGTSFSFVATSIRFPSSSYSVVNEYEFLAGKEELKKEIENKFGAKEEIFSDSIYIKDSTRNIIRLNQFFNDTILIGDLGCFYTIVLKGDSIYSRLSLQNIQMYGRFPRYFREDEILKSKNGDYKMTQKINRSVLKERKKLLSQFEKNIVKKINLPLRGTSYIR